MSAARQPQDLPSVGKERFSKGGGGDLPATMDLGVSERLRPLREAVAAMVRDEIMPLDDEFLAEVPKGDRWTYTDRQTEILEGLKAKARERGLWNFWLTRSDEGPGLTTVEYAYLAEEMGKAHLGAETFNCSAPDTGNMEVFLCYGTDTTSRAFRWSRAPARAAA